MEKSVITESREKELNMALNQFVKLIYVDFGIKKLSNKLKNWYQLTWDEFKKEIEDHHGKFNECLLNDWKDFFQRHKKKVNNLMSE
jgi:RNA processing factor Prp31